jgi:ribosomal 50S subunit-recycling heat shock protein
LRLDKYLKVSRIIKRRTVAKEACDTGRVYINGKSAKPGTEVKVGDTIEIRFGNRLLKAEILEVAEVVRKEGASAMYRVIEGEDTF